MEIRVNYTLYYVWKSSHNVSISSADMLYKLYKHLHKEVFSIFFIRLYGNVENAPILVLTLDRDRSE